MPNSGSLQEGYPEPLRGAARIPANYSHTQNCFLRPEAECPTHISKLCKVSAVPESTGSISLLGSMDWSSDGGGSPNASTLSQSTPVSLHQLQVGGGHICSLRLPAILSVYRTCFSTAERRGCSPSR
jgi:hypothetical protein